MDYENGKRAERPQLAKALASCQAGPHLLVIPALGPLAKDPSFYLQLHVANVDFVALDVPQFTRGALLAMGQAAYRADVGQARIGVSPPRMGMSCMREKILTGS